MAVTILCKIRRCECFLSSFGEIPLSRAPELVTFCSTVYHLRFLGEYHLSDEQDAHITTKVICGAVHPARS